MQVRALTTFTNKKYGLIRRGMVITVPDDYAKALMRNRLVEVFVPPQRPIQPRTAPYNAAIPIAPDIKIDDSDDDAVVGKSAEDGEADAGAAPPPAAKKAPSTSGRRAAGKGKRSSSRPVGRRSRKKT